MVNPNQYPTPASASTSRPASGPGGSPLPRGLVSATTPRPPALTANPDAFSLLKALRRRWIMASILGLLCGIAAAVAAWSLVPAAKYETRAMLSVAQTPPRIIFKIDEDRADFETYKRTQLAIIKSRLLLDKVLNDRRVRDLRLVTEKADPVAWLERQITAEYKGEVLVISMRGDGVEGLAEIVNAVKDVYLDQVSRGDKEARGERLGQLRKIYENYLTELGTKRKLADGLSESVGATGNAALRTYEMAMESRVLVERELRDLNSKLREAEAELEVLQRQSEVTVAASAPNSLIDQQIAQDRRVVELLGRISQLESTIRRVRRIAVGDDPALRAPSVELAETRSLLEARRQQLRAWYVEQYRARGPDGATEDVVALQQRIEVLKKLKEKAGEDLEELSSTTTKVTRNSSELEQVHAEIAVLDAAARKVADQIEVLRIEEDAPTRVSLIEEAKTPQLGADKRPMMAGGAGLGMLGLCLLSVAFLEFRARRIGSVDEVVLGLGLPLIGALPAPPGRSLRRPGGAVPQDMRYNTLLVESIDAIRTRILHASRTEAMRMVMVTSATSGEGKTSLACHLASSLARAGRRTLLIDCDLRRPAVRRLFDLPECSGLSELLRGEEHIDAVVQPVSEWLSVIAAGRVDARAIRALAQDEARAIFERLREQFDFIVVDTSPILPVPDALLVGQHVDAAMCAILRDVSRLPQVYAANERLLTLGIRLLGAVVAGTHGDVYGEDYTYASSATS